MNAPRRDTFIVDCVERVLKYFGRISFLYLFIERRRPATWREVDIWVLCWVAASIISFVCSFFIQSTVIQLAVVIISAIRMLEYLTFISNVLLFRSNLRGSTQRGDLKSFRRSIILLACNYVETIFWFATWYSILSQHSLLKVTLQPACISLLRESVVQMVANSTGNVSPDGTLALAVLTVNSVVGLFMTTVMISWFISLLPRPKSLDEYDSTGG
jgi:hypothetical protein